MMITYSRSRWLRHCTVFGAKTGVGFSIGYMTLITTYGLIQTLSQQGAPDFPLGPVGYVAFGFVVFFAVGAIVGVIPSILIGALTAAWIGLVLWRLRRRVSMPAAIGIGLLSSLVPAAPIQYALWLNIRQWPASGPGGLPLLSLLWFGAPGIIYVVVSAWMASRLFRKLDSDGSAAGISEASAAAAAEGRDEAI